MTYQISISGHADSAKGEAEALAGAADLAEKIGANGSFSFATSFPGLAINAAPAADGVAKAREAVAAYNESADADDQAAPPEPVADEEPS